MRGLPLENCGCFGEWIHLKPQTVIVMDSVVFVDVVIITQLSRAKKFSLDSYFDKSDVMKRIIFLLMVLMAFSVQSWGEDMIKEPNVAGGFYSADPKELSDSIDYFEAIDRRCAD